MTRSSAGQPLPSATADRGSYAEGVGFGAFSFASNALLGLAAGIVIARLYGITVVGEYALAGAPAGAVWLLSTVREQPALMRKLTPLAAHDPRVAGLFAAVFSFSFALTAIVSVLIGLATWALYDGPIGHPGLVPPAVAMLAGSLLFINTCWNFDTVLSAFRAGRALFWCRFHQALVYLVLAVALSLFTHTVWAPIIAWYGSWATSLVQRLISVRPFMSLRPRAADLAAGFGVLPEFLRFGLQLTPGFLAEGISDEAGTWVLAVLAPVSTVGAYNRAWTLARRGLELNYRITEMLFPTLVERRLASDHAGYDRALVDSLRYVATAMLLPAAAAAGAATPIMGIYGQGFARAADAFAFLVFVPGVMTLSAVQSHALFADSRGLLGSLFGIVRAIVTVFAIVLLTHAWGLAGTGAGMLLGACAQLAPLIAGLPRMLSSALRELWKPHELVALLSAGAVGFAVSRALSVALAQLPALALAPALGLGAGSIVFAVLGGVPVRDRERARSLRRALSERWSAFSSSSPSSSGSL